MADGPIRTGINQRESTFRTTAENIANAAPTIQQLAAGTGAGEGFNPGEIPTVGYLANLKANVQQASKSRTDAANTTISGLKPYIRAYRQYLQWRYPKRYGKESTGYTITGTSNYDPYSGLKLPPITEAP